MPSTCRACAQFTFQIYGSIFPRVMKMSTILVIRGVLLSESKLRSTLRTQILCENVVSSKMNKWYCEDNCQLLIKKVFRFFFPPYNTGLRSINNARPVTFHTNKTLAFEILLSFGSFEHYHSFQNIIRIYNLLHINYHVLVKRDSHLTCPKGYCSSRPFV